MKHCTKSNIDELPIRESMHRTHYKESYDMKIYDQGTQNYKIVGRYIDRCLKKSIGKNYDKVKQHILEAMKEHNNARHENNLVESLLSWRVGDGERYVLDSQGRLQENKEWKERTQRWINRRKEKRTTFLIPSERTYKLLNTLTERQIDLLRDVLIEGRVMNIKQFNHLVNGGAISESQYHKLLYDTPLPIKRYDKWKTPIFDYTKQKYVESCFIIEKDCEQIKLEDKSPEYYKWNKERNDASKKQKRQRRKINEAKNETLLHDLEQNKKNKERAKDIVDRDKLGFDESSFKGEFYHGQKRKLK